MPKMELNKGGGLQLNKASMPTLTRASARADKAATVPATGGLAEVDIEQEAANEINEVLTAFKNRAEREDQRFVDATDSEYWVAICFQTRDQKEEFLQKLGLLEMGDKYLDGMRVAHKLGVKLESRVPPLPQLRNDWRLLELT